MLRTLRWRFVLSHVLPLAIIIPVMGIALIYVLETQVLLAGDLGFVGTGDVEAVKVNLREGERMLMALIKALKNKPLTPRTLDCLAPRSSIE